MSSVSRPDHSTDPADFDTTFMSAMSRRVLIGDGAMGTMLQAADLTLDDFNGLEGCNEILNDARPDVLEGIHRAYFEAGADAVETNTFGCNLSNLGDYDIADRIRELAYKGTGIARGVADEMGPTANGTDRFVLGSIGPGTKLPSLGHTTFAVIRDAYFECVAGMLDGGADAILIETSQDLLQVKAAVVAARRAMDKLGRRIPIISHVTVETTGTMLLGSEIGAALTAIEPLGVDMIGLNCATGPAEMSEHLRYLSRHARIPVSVMPNAGLPVLGPNGAEYPLSPEELAQALHGFVAEFGLDFVGGCCGTTPEHIRQVAEAVHGATPAARTPEHASETSSLYTAVPFDQDASFLVIGERTNTNGSKAFREAMIAGDYQRCLDIAKDQTRDGAHMLDLNVDYVGRDGAVDMTALASRFATSSTLPIMLDSTEPEVIRAGLETLGGRCAVNSVNYEDGDGPNSRFTRIMQLVVEHGAAVVALTIDEEGQARTADWKVRIAERLIADITGNWGLAEEDIIIDALTFPISTGQEEVRRDGIETIEAIRRIHEAHPEVHFTLGISNISFGLNPAARQVLNSVFLHECVQAGLDTAIVHASKILPMARIPEEHRKVALDLVYDRRAPGYDPLQKLMELFEGVSAASARESRAAELAKLPLFERLERRIVDGERNGLEDDLDEAMTTVPPLKIINETLLSGMKTVGELFGSGQMQLPFVLQSAEVMKTAVAHLEPHMESTGEDGKGRIVLATVKGDVHDIGKNLVDIILSNNGYEVVNIGIKQPITNILDVAADKKVDVIGMSGLLVKSTVVMKENLEEINARGLADEYPVLLGGAALTRSYVENDLSETYEGDVHYARDAFEGLRLMDEIMATKRGEGPDPDSPEAIAAAEKAAERKARHDRSKRIAAKRKAAEEPVEVPARSDVAADNDIPAPPFWGTRIVKGVPVADYLQLLDERALFLGQWGLRGARGGDGPSYEDLVESEGRPRLRYWIDRLATEGILQHAAVVYGYFPAVSDGDTVHVLTEPRPDAPVRYSFGFPRQQRSRFLCIADFIRSREDAIRDGHVDVLPFQLVTMGQPIADFANELFAADAYRDYLEVHGIGVQLTEALAEYWHQRVRSELRFGERTMDSEDPDEAQGFFDLEYRGARFSFGYGACPDLDDRAKMMELLQPERIGVHLSEELQLHPEQSTDAFVLHHPEAKYFNT
ncbi:methionine synthase [Gordonia bronchialis DSM 43247]|uniref:Methionine synthase n=1 Tax=Gordonia bronchialis (strain ATCC 25592 / DSM 43247 / BCRC 13721 / JCM 3198 / KCTC 3076 / NBRC 16047 / NCTC 10667) TaxID=526226 RepID=D0LDR3_GORB4|nr:methionine synthase [Gordonia bronchialis]ACY21686.1 methionine synthase [Gordonia bronchialis DSM 43247]MCC3324473.1 methionine synthase [Gordonia bronchialis]STQ64574.1 Methionine synthase [Gordonia bronchialis]